jgi:ADP-ribosyl-[dinitrogen reductase] hydrolase
VPLSREEALVGCLLGSAVGDALGLWCEGLSPRRQQRWHTDLTKYHFLFGHGMISDDTEHLCMTAQSLIVSAGDPKPFQRSLAWRLRFWLLGLPAGTGKATARAIVKLWFGGRRGVYSAGNGPAMRSAILGVAYGNDFTRLRELVKKCTELTHTDPRAEFGALTVAWAAHVSHTTAEAKDLPGSFLQGLKELLGPEGEDFFALVNRAVESAQAGQETIAFAHDLGLDKGVTGFINHTVPMVIQAWLRRPDNAKEALVALIRCGGDTDSTGAILGAILGARVGQQGLPQEWLKGLWEWPRSVRWITALGSRLEKVLMSGQPQPPLKLFLPGLLLRNLFFLVVVLLHGFRRLLPPY